MNRDVCEHFNPVDLPCGKCQGEPMTTLRQAAQQALEALEFPAVSLPVDRHKAAVALRAALAEPVQGPLTIERLRDALVASRIIPPAAVEEPDEYDDGVTLFRIEALHRRITAPPAPPHRLTDEEIASMWHANGGFQYHFARAVERAVKRAHNITE